VVFGERQNNIIANNVAGWTVPSFTGGRVKRELYQQPVHVQRHHRLIGVSSNTLGAPIASSQGPVHPRQRGEPDLRYIRRTASAW